MLKQRWLRSQAPKKRRKLTSNQRPSQITAKASDWIEHLDDLEPDARLFLAIRESSIDQERNGNHVPQLKSARSRIGDLGFEIIGHDVFTVSASKGLFEHELWLMRIAQIALEKNAVLVMESVDRFVRNRLYHPIKNPDVLPTVDEMMHLKFLTFGARLATILHPDTPPADVRDRQKERGQRYKENKGGRPPKVSKQDQLRMRIESYHRCGYQNAEIARLIGVSRMTVGRYLEG